MYHRSCTLVQKVVSKLFVKKVKKKFKKDAKFENYESFENFEKKCCRDCMESICCMDCCIIQFEPTLLKVQSLDNFNIFQPLLICFILVS